MNEGQAMKLTRLVVNLNEDTASALRYISTAHGTSITESIRYAISIARFIQSEYEEGRVIETARSDGKMRRRIVVSGSEGGAE